MVSFTALVGYLALFILLGVVFLFSTLLIGKLVRPTIPNAEKEAIYECGEPTIGSSWVQFDLRFYVVALLFVVFDVEVAFFFPWAAVFGKATRVADPSSTIERVQEPLGELGFTVQATTLQATQQAAGNLAVIAFVDLLVFFGVVLVGFIYLWKRGDLDWVRALQETQAAPATSTWSEAPAREPDHAEATV